MSHTLAQADHPTAISLWLHTSMPTHHGQRPGISLPLQAEIFLHPSTTTNPRAEKKVKSFLALS